MVGAAAQVRGVDVDAADTERAANRGGQVERRRQVIQAVPPQPLGECRPEDAGLGPDGKILLVDLEHVAHARHVEQHAAVGDRFAFGGKSTAPHGHRHAMRLCRLEQH